MPVLLPRCTKTIPVLTPEDQSWIARPGCASPRWRRPVSCPRRTRRLGRLANLASEHPQWALSADQRDEFAVWVSDDPPGPPRSEHVNLPRAAPRLASFSSEVNPILPATPTIGPATPTIGPNSVETVYEKEPGRCVPSVERVDGPRHVGVKRSPFGPTTRMRSCRDAHGATSSTALGNAPPEHLASIGHEIGRWLRSVAKTTDGNDQAFPQAVSPLVIAANRDRSSGRRK